MPVSGKLKFGFLPGALLAIALILSGCVKEDNSDCPPDPAPAESVRQLLYLRIADILDGSDLTATEELEDVMVYLFDRDKMLVDTIPYTTSMIRSGMPIDLTDRGMEGGYASVWANINELIDGPDPEFGESINSLSLDITPDLERADFFLCPGDIFFGYEQIDFNRIDPTLETDTVTLMRKNARLSITVRGLPAGADHEDYYFRIRPIFSGYEYDGDPRHTMREIWETGIFQDDDLISPDPYWMIHHPANVDYTDENSVEIDLYGPAASRTDGKIGSAVRDVNGRYIHLERGKTTNVLIVIDDTSGEIQVHLALTPWYEVHQWTIW